jgi:hypothetical protein
MKVVREHPAAPPTQRWMLAAVILAAVALVIVKLRVDGN